LILLVRRIARPIAPLDAARHLGEMPCKNGLSESHHPLLITPAQMAFAETLSNIS